MQSPDMQSPDMQSPDMQSPDMQSPDMQASAKESHPGTFSGNSRWFRPECDNHPVQPPAQAPSYTRRQSDQTGIAD